MSDEASKLKGLAWIALAGVIALLFVLGLSPMAHAIPWRWEKKMAEWFNMTATPEQTIEIPKAKKLVDKIIHRIYPIKDDDQAFTINVKVIRDDEINAHAELGGDIFVNSGMIKQAESPEELAGVLAHEIEHVRHRHVMEGVIHYLFTLEGVQMIFNDANSSAASLTNYLFTINFTRSQEKAADKDALLRLQNAHVDNKGFKAFFARMLKKHDESIFISDHPSDKSRLEMASAYKNIAVTPILSQKEWKSLKKLAK